jgi:quinoprotein glucose dehydrogenase
MVVYTGRAAASTRLIPRAQCDDRDRPVGQPQTGTPYCVETGFVSSPLGVPCTEPPWGTLDRNMAPFPFWWIEGLPGFAAPMMTDTGLIFAGISNDHAIRAFDVRDGSELWRAELPTAANALPMTYQIRPDGRQFVVVAAGGHWAGGSPPGDHIIAYALPDPTP